ncbi:DUF1707 domain-containing protein [Streptomyces griseofuscus]|uniref:DUF1707 SHOCT-like domain-containing protein n=1 Tax=Streptomyces TaxID=1883 RepID=UPI00081F49B0|nr:MULTISPECIES: DUF1707 domain-containing protein [unclassified Streptomyces]MBJ7003171.1 DUF1707 and DUF2154 domain-containing protein [Streptomyces sp. CRPSP2-6A1]MYQ90276.1 DUF1707 domain-containing protein [Streptomyces sp. SID4946]SCF57590.1 Cell wall-active antibiotics response 4TMS YvqF [Streptomyces sp. LamerLS-31b]SCF59337.1 Cell wall-active antibiotics response 4TMS YvqF [Streptomyces sp. DconLS]
MDLQKPARTQDATPSVSALRASDADRDRVADILREALAEGRLTADEHAERVDGVLNAKTVGELEVFIEDLPAAHQHASRAAYTPAPPRPTDDIPSESDANVVAVFSSAVRRGRWRAGRRMHAYSIFGSVEIDLSEAIFEYQQVVIKAVSVFGDIQIRVPENVSLRGTGGGVLGNFEVATLDSTETDAPVVYIDGWAVLGNVEARPKRGKLVSDILERVQDKVERKLRKRLDR